MINHNIGIAEGVTLGVITICSKVFLALPQQLAALGGTAAWLVALIGALHGPLCWWALRGILRRHPGETLVTATAKTFGPVVGNLFNLIYFAYFFSLSAIVQREFSEVHVGTFLLRTPLPFALAALFATAIYLTYLGMEAIGRTAAAGGGFILAGLVLLLVGALLTHAEPAALAPYWGTGAAKVIRAGLFWDPMSGVLAFGLIAPSFRSPRDLDRTVWITIVLSTVIMVATTIVVLYVFPYPSAMRVNNPLLAASRVISLGAGLQRVESVFFLIWVVASVIAVAVVFSTSAAILTQMLHLKSYRHLLPALSVMVFTLAMIPRNISQVSQTDSFLRTYSSVATVLLPYLTWLATALRQRGGAKHAAV